MPDAAVEEIPGFIAPMLASAGATPTEAGWALEVKWDGMRAQLRFDGRRVCLRSRPAALRAHTASLYAGDIVGNTNIT